MDQVGPTQNTAGATSGDTFDPDIGGFVVDLVEGFSGFVPQPAAEGDTTTNTTVYEAAPAPNYIPIALAAVVGAIAIAWALK